MPSDCATSRTWREHLRSSCCMRLGCWPFLGSMTSGRTDSIDASLTLPYILWTLTDSLSSAIFCSKHIGPVRHSPNIASYTEHLERVSLSSTISSQNVHVLSHKETKSITAQWLERKLDWFTVNSGEITYDCRKTYFLVTVTHNILNHGILQVHTYREHKVRCFRIPSMQNHNPWWDTELLNRAKNHN